MPSSVLGKKKLRQTQIQIRKSKQQQLLQPTRKKIRFTFLSPNEQLLYFKIPESIEVFSPRIPNDCVICSLQFLKIINSYEATDLRLRMIKRNTADGISFDDIIIILGKKLQTKYKDIYFRDIPYSKAYLLFEAIPMEHAFVVGLHPKNGQSVGHMVILFKDHRGQIGLIDPQNDHVCINSECSKYLETFTHERLTVFIGKPISG